MKKIIIIGAGIAGLTSAIYARLNGFDVEIYEMHSIAGGQCTGWDRGDYHFDGCIHWLVGSKPGTGMNQLWRDIGAIDDTVQSINHEVFLRYEEGGQAVNLYTNPKTLKKHLIEVSPQDKKAIKKLVKAILALSNMEMPLDKPIDMMTPSDGMKFALTNLRPILSMSHYNKMTMSELANTFQSPLLQRAILSAIPGDYSAAALVMTLSGMGAGDNGYPLGGSRAFAQRMEKRLISLGGKIHYKTVVKKIRVENNEALSILLSDGTQINGDYILSCADGYETLYQMLDNRYTPENYAKLYANPKVYPTATCALVFLGINTKLSDYPSVTIHRSQPKSLNGIETDAVQIVNHSFDPECAPKGKTVISCFYQADYDYWQALAQDKKKYREEKKKLEADAIAILLERYPEAKDKIEKTDVVTPMTYVRYCNAWRGSYMSWGSVSEDIPQSFSGVLPGLSRFLMAGMWTQPPGGLPGAAMAGRFAVQRLCIREGISFKTE